MGPATLLLRSNQCCLPQYLKVLGYGRFGYAKMTDKSTHAWIADEKNG